VGFVFYQPAPELSAWYKQEKTLKKQGVPKKQRPPKPAPNPEYPTKQQRVRLFCNDTRLDKNQQITAPRA
jgi:hypothetical protein